MTKINKTLIILLATIGLVSCGNSYVLSPERLEDVLVDMHLVEGIALEQPKTFNTNEKKVSLYKTVFDKYGIDQSQFDSSMVYYSENLGELGEIYDAVYERLTTLEIEVEEGLYSFTKLSIDKNMLARIFLVDNEILPYVQNELWGRQRSYTFKYADFAKGKSEKLTLDTLTNTKFELRYALEADSLESLQCQVKMYYGEKKAGEESFDLALSSTDLANNTWEVSDSITKVIVLFEAKPLNKNAKLNINDVRLYELSPESHSTKLFN